jgi:hypothetical protein
MTSRGVALRFALAVGGANCRSLGFGRDDKSESGAFKRQVLVEGRNSRSLHFAPPDFLLNLVTLVKFMRLSLRKAAYVAIFGFAG